MSPVTCSTQDKLGNDIFSIHKLVGDNNTGGISVSSFVLHISLQQNKTCGRQTSLYSFSMFFVLQIPLQQNKTCEWKKLWRILSKFVCTLNIITTKYTLWVTTILENSHYVYCPLITITAKYNLWVTNILVFSP